MPNVLVFGGSDTSFQEISADPRWTALRARHDNFGVHRDQLGDPRSWNLILDVCVRKQDEVQEIARPSANRDYLAETGAYVVQFVGSAAHRDVKAESPEGFKDLRLSPTNDPACIFLESFIEEFGAKMRRARLVYATGSMTPNKHRELWEKRGVLYTDTYGDPVISFSSKRRELLLVDLIDDSVRDEAMVFLLNRTLPQLWPDLYADLLEPRRVAALRRARESLAQDYRIRADALERMISEEQSYFAQYIPLLQVPEDSLKHLVGRALGEVFEFQVTDLDESMVGGEPKRSTLPSRVGTGTP